MARSQLSNTLVKVGLLFFGYKMAAGGALDNLVTPNAPVGRRLSDMLKLTKDAAGDATAPIGQTQPGSSTNPQAGIPDNYYNPGFGSVARQWRQARYSKGENYRDWNAFVEHLKYIGFGDYTPFGPPAGW